MTADEPSKLHFVLFTGYVNVSVPRLADGG